MTVTNIPFLTFVTQTSLATLIFPIERRALIQTNFQKGKEFYSINKLITTHQMLKREKENILLSVLGFLPLIFYKQVTTVKQQ